MCHAASTNTDMDRTKDTMDFMRITSGRRSYHTKRFGRSGSYNVLQKSCYTIRISGYAVHEQFLEDIFSKNGCPIPYPGVWALHPE